MSTKSFKSTGSTPDFKINNKYSRHFSEEFRRQKVQEICNKTLKIKDLCELYSISHTTVYKWIYLYSPHHERGSRQIVEMESEAHKTKLLQQRVVELERAVGVKQMEIDYLNKLIELAGKELSLDLKKNFAARTSSGIVNIEQNTSI
jgi:transposase